VCQYTYIIRQTLLVYINQLLLFDIYTYMMCVVVVCAAAAIIILQTLIIHSSTTHHVCEREMYSVLCQPFLCSNHFLILDKIQNLKKIWVKKPFSFVMSVSDLSLTCWTSSIVKCSNSTMR